MAWIASIAAAVALAYAGPVSAWMDARDEHAAAVTRLAGAERTLRTVERQVANLRAPGMLEQEARRLGMARPGETMIVIDPPRRP